MVLKELLGELDSLVSLPDNPQKSKNCITYKHILYTINAKLNCNRNEAGNVRGKKNLFLHSGLILQDWVNEDSKELKCFPLRYMSVCK